MATDIGTLVMKFEAEDKNLNKAFNNASEGVKKVGAAVATTVKVAAAATIAATVAVGGVAIKAITLAANQEKAEARLESIAKTVTKATEEQIVSMKKLAGVYQELSTFGDEVILTGQSQLLSFGLTTEQTEQLTGSLTDLLAATKGVNATSQDAIGVANLLGKAFNGQAGALSEAGILLNDTQAAILKNGTAAEKTSILVDILNQNYGGLAETLSNTTEGQLQQLKNTLGDIGEVMGQALLPVFKTVLDFIQGNMPKIKETILNTWNNVIEVVKGVYNFFNKNILPIFRTLYEYVSSYYPVFKDIFLQAFEGIKIAGNDLWEFFKKNVLPIIKELYDWAVRNMPMVKEKFTEVFEKMKELGVAFWEFYTNNLLPILEKFYAYVYEKLPLIEKIFKTNFELAMLTIGALIDSLTWLFEELDKIQTKVETVTGAIKDAFQSLGFLISPVMFLMTKEINGTTSALEKMLNLFGIAKKLEGSTSDAYYGPTQNVIDGQMAYGGNVVAGKSYLVGERGPETFTPGTSGSISNKSSNIVINVNGAGDPMATASQIVGILKAQGV